MGTSTEQATTQPQPAAPALAPAARQPVPEPPAVPEVIEPPVFTDRTARFDWDELAGDLTTRGVTRLPALLSVEECVALSRETGAAIAKDFGVPVYLYEDSASSELRRNLAEIRKGQFEGFAQKMKDARWAPDFGPAEPHPSAGVVAVGARAFLIAYNINLATRDLAIADRIAKAIRHLSGGFRYVKAMGVELADRGIVQVSINMTNFKKTPLHRVFECVRSEAERHGVAIVGSEIVGLSPAEALYAAAEHLLRLEGFSAEQVLETKLLEE